MARRTLPDGFRLAPMPLHFAPIACAKMERPSRRAGENATFSWKIYRVF